MRLTLERAEGAVAALLTLAAVWLHSQAALYAGALWRDEANTVGLATLPTLRDVWDHLQFDSFPILWVLMVRQLTGVFGEMNDAAFRTTGAVIGFLIVAGLWLNARVFGHRYPLVSLSLLALSPSVVRWGDSLRAYGLGIALSLATCALVWRYVVRPGPWRFAAATVSALLSVHTIYYNAPVLLAICAGAIAVCVARRELKKAGAILAIGVIAAGSLVPYVFVIGGASAWNSLVSHPDYDLGWFFLKLNEALAPGGPWAIIIWIDAFFLALWAGARKLGRQESPATADRRTDAVLFGLVTAIVGTLSIYLFLRTLSYVTQPWYYLSLLAIAGLCLDILSGALVQRYRVRIIRLAAVLTIGIATIVPATRAVRVRLTNADLAASVVERRAVRGDLVVVAPWYVGVSFDRYYDGSAAWTTVPAINFHRFHRYDLLSTAVRQPDQMVPAKPAIDEASRALRSGNSVFMVGGIPAPRYTAGPLLPPANLPGDGPRSGLYESQWTLLLTSHVYRHATSLAVIRMPDVGRVSFYEDFSIIVARGWRD